MVPEIRKSLVRGGTALNGLGLLVLVVLIVIYIWLRREDNKKWETIYDAHGRGLEALYRRLAYLQARGVRCRMKSTFSTGHQSSGQARASLPFAPRAILQVHREDSQRAQALWRESGGGERGVSTDD